MRGYFMYGCIRQSIVKSIHKHWLQNNEWNYSIYVAEMTWSINAVQQHACQLFTFPFLMQGLAVCLTEYYELLWLFAW